MSLELVDEYRSLNMATAEGISESVRLVEALFKSMDRVMEARRQLDTAIAAESNSDQGSTMSSVENLQPGECIGFATDPLESAIESTARVMRDERESMAQISMTVGGDIPSTSLHSRMGEHLDKLLALQLKRLDQC